MSLTLSVIGCIVGLGLLMYLTYNGAAPIAAVPACAMIVALFSGLPLVDTMLSTFTGGFANVFATMGFICVCGGMFGKCFSETGSAFTIADWIAKTFGTNRVCWAVVVATGILTIGGMGWGAYITMYAIGHILCAKANLNRNILIGCILCGAWTFAIITPLIPSPHNAILMAGFGTSSTAGLVPGLAAGIVMLLGGCFYLDWQSKKWRDNGKAFDSSDSLPKEEKDDSGKVKRPNMLQALAPIIVILVLFNVFKFKVPAAMFCSSIVCIIVNFNAFTPKQWLGIVNKGCQEGIIPFVNVSVLGGFGAVVAATPFMALVVQTLQNSTMHPYVLAVLAGNTTGLILGTASGACALTVNTVGPLLMQMAQTGGYSIGNMHRLIVVSAPGLGALPNNGSIASVNAAFGTNHKESYFPVFITCAVIPFIAAVCIALPLALLGFS